MRSAAASTQTDTPPPLRPAPARALIRCDSCGALVQRGDSHTCAPGKGGAR